MSPDSSSPWLGCVPKQRDRLSTPVRNEMILLYKMFLPSIAPLTVVRRLATELRARIVVGADVKPYRRPNVIRWSVWPSAVLRADIRLGGGN